MNRGDREFDELQAAFENQLARIPVYIGEGNPRKHRVGRREDGSWPKHFYECGKTEFAFQCWLSGYAHGKAVFAEVAHD